MNRIVKTFAAAAALAAPFFSSGLAAQQGGAGDLLVAPTRLVLDGRRGAEVILNNIGTEPATYRISVEFRRMTPEGGLADVEQPTALHEAARDMIVYAPRRITLAPNKPQAIRVMARPPKGLPDGEYRVHMLFRAIPPANPVVPRTGEKQKGVSFALIPVYGVTIPVIVRLGNLDAKAGIANVELEDRDGKQFVELDLSRSGDRSTYGEVRVLKPGVKDPIAIQRAVAVYTEVGSRKVTIPVDETFAGDVRGPVTVEYRETFEDGTRTIAEAQAVLR